MFFSVCQCGSVGLCVCVCVDSPVGDESLVSCAGLMTDRK